MRKESGFQIAPKSRKNDNGVTICQHDVKVKSFLTLFYYFFFVRFNYRIKFHVNIITGSGVMTIFFYKRLTRNPEIGNTPICVLPNIWRLEWVRNTKVGTNISNETKDLCWNITSLMNAAKCQDTAFTVFELLREIQQGG